MYKCTLGVRATTPKMTDDAVSKSQVYFPKPAQSAMKTSDYKVWQAEKPMATQ